jgi:regulator of sirC expression with transglutaminase-like and TPR domain
MDVVERFASLVARDPDDVPLDEAALLIAARARAGADTDAGFDFAAPLAALDAHAGACATPTFDAVRAELFARAGYRGNVENYDDPANSYLDRVLERRVGIPITLSVVMMEVGRRAGVPITGIGMPGHFLVSAPEPGVYCDPFGGGRVLDVDGCAALFATATRGRMQFDPTLLAPVRPQQILARMLANLEHGPLAADPVRLAALLDLHLVIPGLGATERVSVATRLAGVGRFHDAARVVEAGADDAPEPEALRRQARALRARLN